MAANDELLAMADELEGVSLKDDCESCLASGTGLCRGDLECAESAHKACAKRLREIVEHDECEVTTVSAYDLLPDEDREAIAWVREHGGVENCAENLHRLEKSVSEDSCLRMAVGDLLGINAFKVLDMDVYDLAGSLKELDKRLMPEGMEWLLEVWPKWSNGEYCKFGDWWMSDKYGESEPKQFRKLSIYTPEQLREWGQDDGDHFGYEWDFVRPANPKYRPDKVEPPAPNVLAADGEPLEVGQTVWDVESGTEYEVVGIHTDEDTPVRVMRTDGSHLAKAAKPSTLTHQRPVLDADGVPIKEGDTVYLLPGEWCDRFPCLGFYGGEELNVIDLNPKHGVSGSIKCCKADKMTGLCYPQSSQLTHAKPEPPDSWERIEEDVELSPADYISKYGRKTKLYAYEEVPRDLVRRCKALADRGE